MMPGFDRFRIIEANDLASRKLNGRARGDVFRINMVLARIRYRAGLHLRWAELRQEMDSDDVRLLRADAAKVVRQLRRLP